MDSTEVSRTAIMTAGSRGWHLVRHGKQAVFDDWVGWPLAGSDFEGFLDSFGSLLGDALDPMGTWIAARSRITEDWLATSEREQFVILGAGLDTYAWRHQNDVRVIEVDHPATQAWKRARLDKLGLPTPANLEWVPVDFETESIADGLRRAQLTSQPTFISWLGVTMYLSLDAIRDTLSELPPCALAVSYDPPEDMWDERARPGSEQFSAMATQLGEPLVSLLTPSEIAEVLSDSGFEVNEDVGAEDVEGRYGLTALSLCGERIVLATKNVT
jgi:methyltransferase (TIGR00027 family)